MNTKPWGLVAWTHTVFAFMLMTATYAGRALWADGAHFFLQVLDQQTFHVVWPTRVFANGAVELLLVGAVRCGVTNLRVLQLFFGLGCFTIWPISMAICYRLAPRHYWLVLIACGAGYCNAAFMAIGEHIIAHASFWPAFFAAVFVRPLTPFAGSILIASVLVMVGSYESVIFFGPIVGVVCFLRAARRQETGWARTVLFFAGAVSFLGAGFSCYAMRYFAAINSDGFRAGVWKAVIHPSWTLGWTCVWLAALAIGSLGRKFPGYVESQSAVARGLVGLAIAFWGLRPLTAPGTVNPGAQYDERFLNLVVPLGLALIGLVAAKDPEWLASRRRYVVRMAALLLLAQSVWHLSATWQWQGYTNTLRGVLSAARGPVLEDRTLLALPAVQGQSLRFGWFWTSPALSVCVAPNGRVESLIVTPLGLRWPRESFHPFRPETFPNLSRYGVDWQPYIDALAKLPPPYPAASAP